MDSLLVSLHDLKSALKFDGTMQQLSGSGLISAFCERKRVIARIRPDDLSPDDRTQYTRFLVELTRAFISEHPDIKNWADFSKRADTRKVHKLLFEYGVRAEVFPDVEVDSPNEELKRSPTSITLPELYEVCQIKFHFQGSFLSFKKELFSANTEALRSTA